MSNDDDEDEVLVALVAYVAAVDDADKPGLTEAEKEAATENAYQKADQLRELGT
ncbi:hypothetical protein [Streptomyces carpaticus]|uniref:Uncharacterized protein n=1 Tax=Streptomyces carpaticus TaxID=285558 RepID=A0ABV4ZJZ7_9ACTN